MTNAHLPLKALREQRGWTQHEVAEQVGRMAWLRRHERVGVNADMVAKWERGEKKPSPLYRELLSLVFETDSHSLGLGGPAHAAAHGSEDLDGNSLIEMLGGAASLLDQLGTAGAILQPRMFDVWKDELMQRRALLKLMGLATAAGVVPIADRELSRSAKATPGDADSLDHLTDRYQALYHSTAPALLMTPVVAHLETVGDFLRLGAVGPLLRRLFANQARVANLAGRLAFCDLNDSLAARGYYNLALESAREAGDHLQGAAALAHMSFIPAADREYSAALDYLKAAGQQAAKHPDGRVESWLAAAEAEFRANAGAHAASLKAIDLARDRLAKPGLIADLPWLDFYDSTRLSGFAGYALARDGQLEASKASLMAAAEQLPRTAVKQKAVFLADIATVELAGGELDRACASASEAAESLRLVAYAHGAWRLREFRRSVEPWADSAPVRTLDEQLAML
ncbi:MAG TPA: helix-turn-helix transcriptional regulator [Streptosporangiaceae bacterium]|nr:helix-turn-helix transcriptional regulator [Streptosporangiaceae bacterium]